MNCRCMKCKVNVEAIEGTEVITKNSMILFKGKCPDCGTTVCKMLGKKK